MTPPKRIEYIETHSFQRELKSLLKKYRTLESDIEVFKKNSIELCHLKGIKSPGIVEISRNFSKGIDVCKVRRFACRALKGRGSDSGIRITYAFHAQSYRVEFIEIYFKGNKANEDRDRIKRYLKSF